MMKNTFEVNMQINFENAFLFQFNIYKHFLLYILNARLFMTYIVK